MNKALKLFVLKNSSGAIVTGDDGEPLFFSDKMRAKDHKKSLVIEGTTVSVGPDHHRYQGDDT
tara:strand:+ start:2544 stop:2732 length:189 start_codon:yes stop_codon:yes gene_type:complete